MRIAIYKIIILFLLPCSLLGKTISPLDYGLRQAKTGEERFNVLYQTHLIAKKNQWNVSYKGIKEIMLNIPSNAKSIQLGNVTDFSNVIFTVTNTQIDNFYLFELSQKLHQVSVPKIMFDTYDFRRVDELSKGYKILVVVDQNLWVEDRKGFDTAIKRSDILLLKDGVAINRTISPYNNLSSNPTCKFTEVSNDQKIITKATLNRTKESSVKTFFVKVMNTNNVLLQDITINTPLSSKLSGDKAIRVNDCTNICLKNIKINQTYSFKDAWGYGINLNNVWNSWIESIECEAAWGIFGNNNLNTVHLSNSKINRFDNHCYGRDFYYSNCIFSQFGLPQSAFFGDLDISKCTFRKAYVCLARTEYNAYTPFKITLRECNIYLDKRHRSLVNLGNINTINNNRKELQIKRSPALNILNSKVILPEDVSNWSLFSIGSESSEIPFESIGDININGLKVIGNTANLMIFDRSIRCENTVVINLSGIDLLNSEKDFLFLSPKKYAYSPTILFNINKDGDDSFFISNSKFNYSPDEFPFYNLFFSNCILGRIRYPNTKQEETKRRRYLNCKLYLNDIDKDFYSLDDNADYLRCTFIPVDKNKKVSFYSMRHTSEITIKDCSSVVKDLFNSRLMKTKLILKSYKYKFNK